MTDLGVVLLAEDRDDDVFLIRRSFQRAELNNPLHVVRDGAEAIDYLRGAEKYSNRDEHPLPSLILLDLKMPRVDGFEVIEWVRSHPTLRSIPIVVLTSSSLLRDVNQAYQLGANSFLVKPLDFENFANMASLLKTYWLDTSLAPDGATRPTENPREIRKRE
jgi:CheY-like chemotaxis protein